MSLAWDFCSRFQVNCAITVPMRWKCDGLLLLSKDIRKIRILSRYSTYSGWMLIISTKESYGSLRSMEREMRLLQSHNPLMVYGAAIRNRTSTTGTCEEAVTYKAKNSMSIASCTRAVNCKIGLTFKV